MNTLLVSLFIGYVSLLIIHLTTLRRARNAELREKQYRLLCDELTDVLKTQETTIRAQDAALVTQSAALKTQGEALETQGQALQRLMNATKDFLPQKP